MQCHDDQQVGKEPIMRCTDAWMDLPEDVSRVSRYLTGSEMGAHPTCFARHAFRRSTRGPPLRWCVVWCGMVWCGMVWCVVYEALLALISIWAFWSSELEIWRVQSTP